jgi:hypothetical protein
MENGPAKRLNICQFFQAGGFTMLTTVLRLRFKSGAPLTYSSFANFLLRNCAKLENRLLLVVIL